MERYYDGDQEKLYAEARVVNPYRKSVNVPRKVGCPINLLQFEKFLFSHAFMTLC